MRKRILWHALALSAAFLVLTMMIRQPTHAGISRTAELAIAAVVACSSAGAVFVVARDRGYAASRACIAALADVLLAVALLPVLAVAYLSLVLVIVVLTGGVPKGW